MDNKKSAAFLQDLKDNVVNVALSFGMDANAAHKLAYEIGQKQRAIWGAQIVYFPSGDREDLDKRDQEIWDNFTGNNHEDLVRKFKVSMPHIYRIIKVMRGRENSKRQGRLDV